MQQEGAPALRRSCRPAAAPPCPPPALISMQVEYTSIQYVGQPDANVFTQFLLRRAGEAWWGASSGARHPPTPLRIPTAPPCSLFTGRATSRTPQRSSWQTSRCSTGAPLQRLPRLLQSHACTTPQQPEGGRCPRLACRFQGPVDGVPLFADYSPDQYFNVQCGWATTGRWRSPAGRQQDPDYEPPHTADAAIPTAP